MRILLLLLILPLAPLGAQGTVELVEEKYPDSEQVSDRYTKIDGKIEGKREKFYPDGKAEFIGYYFNDHLVGRASEFYPNEKPRVTGTFVDGYLTGQVTWYYSNNVIERQGNVQGTLRNSFLQAKPTDGPWIENHSTGDPYISCNFKGGRLIGDAVLWSAERKPKRKITFVAGGLRGTATTYDAKGNPVEQGDETFSPTQDWFVAFDGGTRQGRWQKFFAAGGTAFDCTYIDGLLDGAATEFYAPEKPRRAGFFIDGRLSGTFWHFHENGEIRETGRVSSSNRNSFDGQIRQGRWEWYTQARTVSLEATYKDSLFEGEATSYYDSRNPKVKGTFSKGRLTGTLTRYYDSKVVMESGGVSGSYGLNVLGSEIRHGKWVCRHQNDVVSFEGTYKDNYLEGAATSYYKNREKDCEGTFKKGRLTGTLTRYHDNKQVAETGEVSGNRWENTFRSEVREGAWICRHRNGKKSFTGTYVKNLLQGEAIGYYWSERKRVQGTFNKGRLIGTLTRYYDEDDKVLETGEVSGNNWENEFKLEVREGPWVFRHQNGELSFQGTYKKNLLEGEATSYHENGKPRAKGTFKSGRLTGKVTRYYDNEKPLEEGEVSRNLHDNSFEGLVREGAWVEYHDNGQKSGEGSYKNNEKIGTWAYYDREGKPIK